MYLETLPTFIISNELDDPFAFSIGGWHPFSGGITGALKGASHVVQQVITHTLPKKLATPLVKLDNALTKPGINLSQSIAKDFAKTKAWAEKHRAALIAAVAVCGIVAVCIFCPAATAFIHSAGAMFSHITVATWAKLGGLAVTIFLKNGKKQTQNMTPDQVTAGDLALQNAVLQQQQSGALPASQAPAVWKDMGYTQTPDPAAQQRIIAMLNAGQITPAQAQQMLASTGYSNPSLAGVSQSAFNLGNMSSVLSSIPSWVLPAGIGILALKLIL